MGLEIAPVVILDRVRLFVADPEVPVSSSRVRHSQVRDPTNSAVETREPWARYITTWQRFQFKSILLKISFTAQELGTRIFVGKFKKFPSGTDYGHQES